MTINDCFSVISGDIRTELVQKLIDCGCHYVAILNNIFKVEGLLINHEFEMLFRNTWQRYEIDADQVLSIIDYTQTKLKC